MKSRVSSHAIRELNQTHTCTHRQWKRLCSLKWQASSQSKRRTSLSRSISLVSQAKKVIVFVVVVVVVVASNTFELNINIVLLLHNSFHFVPVKVIVIILLLAVPLLPSLYIYRSGLIKSTKINNKRHLQSFKS